MPANSQEARIEPPARNSARLRGGLSGLFPLYYKLFHNACTSLLVKSRVLPTDTGISLFFQLHREDSDFTIRGRGSERARERGRALLPPSCGGKGQRRRLDHCLGSAEPSTKTLVQRHPGPTPWCPVSCGHVHPAVRTPRKPKHCLGPARTQHSDQGHVARPSNLNPEPSTLNTNPASQPAVEAAPLS